VLLDGTWSQAKALWWRNAWMLKCQRVILGPKRPSAYGKLRKEPRQDGLLVATAELKTDFTQSIDDAIDQYRFDRNPRPKGQSVEPLLNFPSGAFVHFAVSNSEVHMTTQLAGPATGFLPFNKGNQGAKENPSLNGRDIRDAFKGDDFQILLVANKFQTGFDQPLLCGMYVNRRLAGIQAVQTLSRVNRAYPGKDTTYVLDFVNSSEEVLAAFKTCYDTAELEGVTDPNLVYDLRAKLDASGSGHYDEFEVDRIVSVEMNPKAKQGDLIAALEPVADRLLNRFKQAQEKLLAARAKKDDKAAEEANGEINALILFKADMGSLHEREKARLEEIIAKVNDLFEGDLTDDDQLVYVNNVIKGKLLESK
jgi:type I site-specific restriction-modification system R (restriction) subunit